MSDGHRIVAQLCKLLDDAEAHDVKVIVTEDLLTEKPAWVVTWWDRHETYSTHHCYILRETPEGWNGVPTAG